ncbi:MAG: hypothetical protein IPJ65_11860 [Archangiaceae bacterium]|nr:hypothetical protein [Archangiaceae bacterium]
MALRALVAAHAQSAWNRSTRQLTRGGRNLALAFIAVCWGVGTLGFSTAMLALGWAAGRDLDGRGLTLAGATLFALSWGLGLMFGLTGSGRLLEVGQLKAYPVRPLTLLFAELAARAAEPLTLGCIMGLTALHVGLAVAQPGLIPRLVVMLAVHLVVLLGAQFVLGELLAAIARRARIALVLVGALAMGFSPRVAAWLDGPRREHGFERLLRLTDSVRYLPSTRLLGAPAGGWDALGRLCEGLAGPLMLLLIGAWVMGREHTAHAAVATEREKGLWTFDSPDAGIARLHLSTLFRTPLGRYSLVAPLFAMVMVPWVMQMLFHQQRASLAVFIYAALGTVQFHFNLFGFDGPAVAELFRLPVSSATLLRGKHLAVLSLALLEGAVLAVFLRLVREESSSECIAGLCVFLTINLMMATLGRFVSAVWPRTLSRSGLRGTAPPLPVVLVNLFGTFAIAGSLGLTHWLVMHYAPAYVVPWGVGALLLGAAVFALTLKPAAAFLEARREHVLLSMK